MRFSPLLLICAAVCLACVASCVKLPRRHAVISSLTNGEIAHAPDARAATPPPLNINTASREELARLPGIGPGLAARIVEHRERHGAFRRVEHLIIVRGISEKRFAALRAFVRAH